MFTGTMIDDLIKTVEKTEQLVQWRTVALPPDPVETYPMVSVYQWQWAAMDQSMVGVA